MRLPCLGVGQISNGIYTDEDRDKLQSLRDQTNPRRLRQDIYQLIDDFFSLPDATPGITESIYPDIFNPHIPTERRGHLGNIII